ncbi:hypothetical protein SAMN06269185_2904 [Natronoarchaeum philippinense]|uniref:Uncharacterized protein n=1 Tax=Natronoarchaeum philippinense TaxID=558529 RepID=A0A285P7I3_NATPI|nr:DUF5812 family protein [Natronoarchaeum philippinense]SNZ17163.1 hypothetical protein SAMN06269185_2904 [Natronoarchaeum philippinense]
MSEKTGTFLVTHADEGSAVFRDVSDGQVHTMASNPDVAEQDVLEATIRPQPPMEVAWEVVEVAERREIELVDTDLSPTTQAMEIAAEQEVGDVERVERAGEGEVHVLSVPPETTEDAAADVLDDEGTIERAARLGAVRVEVRREEDDGVLNVRYLPD